MQAATLLTTMFAPAERASAEELSSELSLIKGTPSLIRILDSVMDMVVVLNRHRQIVFGNAALVENLGLHDVSTIYGLRPGEAVGCANSAAQPAGCGTDEHCSVCGAVNAIVVAFGGKEQTNECHILRGSGEALDLLVKATPFRLGGEGFIMVSMRDISDQMRHRIMERIFHHDVLNTACGIQLLSQTRTWSGRANRILDNINKGIGRLIKEIHFQQDLAAAEHGQLAVKNAPFKAADIVQELVAAWEPFAKAQNCAVVTACLPDVELSTDRRLLSRVISNMLKNAIEASSAGDKVTIACRLGEGAISFSVSNKAVIPHADQLQLFQRSFSTKGHGRGVGTYSMKLLTEKYLGGTISFTSAEPQGTTFTVPLPLTAPTA
jgi:hypothetical protein